MFAAKLATGAAVMHSSPLSVPRISSNTAELAVFGAEWSLRLTSSIGDCGEEGNEAADGASTRATIVLRRRSRMHSEGEVVSHLRQDNLTLRPWHSC